MPKLGEDMPVDVRDDMVELLEATAARLRDKGWTQGEPGPAAGPNCIMGALGWEAGARRGTNAGYGSHGAAARILTFFLGQCPTTWNDRTCPDANAAVDMLLTIAKEVAGATP